MTHEPAGLGDLATTVTTSSLSTVFWVEGALPQARGAVTLWRNDRPALAFTYADAQVARNLSGCGRIGLAFTEPRGTGHWFRPLVATGVPSLVADRDGSLFSEDLLEQELRRFPPARLFADSPLLRREHWWYMPRLIVEIAVDSVHSVDTGSGRRDHILVTYSDSEGLHGRPAGVVDETAASLGLDVDGPAIPRADRVDALLFGQDASFPDLERWSQWRFRGHWDGTAFAVSEAPARRGLAPVPGLMTRLRRQRALERACRQALAAT